MQNDGMGGWIDELFSGNPTFTEQALVARQQTDD
jgi:hypothetical protein